jgi:hypothetical protein
MGMKLEIHIEELVLHGFAGLDRYAIGDAVSAALERLISEQGSPALFAESQHTPTLRTPPVQMAAGGLSPEGMGTQIANTLYQSLSQPPVEGKST